MGQTSRFRAFAIVACIAVAGSCSGPARWLRGNLHTHSLWSDGNDFPENIAKWYRDQGYDFLALSDHNILSEGEKWMDIAEVERRGGDAPVARCRANFGDGWIDVRDRAGKRQVRLKTLAEVRSEVERPGEFLMIASEEITDRAHGRFEVHINATNVGERIQPQHGDGVRAVMRRNLAAIEAQERRLGRPILGHLNHPNFKYSVTAEDLAAVVEERFFEVYNGHRGVAHLGDDRHASVERIWDIATTIRLAEMRQPPLFGLATDDSHHYQGRSDVSRPGRGWIMVLSPRLRAEAIVEAMRRGDFYATSGVELKEVRREGRTLRLVVDPEPGVSYVTRFVGTPVDYDRSSQPVLDPNGRRIRTTRRYSENVGMVLATVNGLEASYKLTGKELYVRAVVTSSKPHPDPSFDGQTEQAWTQPIWEPSRVR